MNRPTRILFFFVMLFLTLCSFPLENSGWGEESQSPGEVERPRIYLDKSPRIVEYQLNRLSNQRLLLVEREPNHKKYVPVYAAILGRAGMSRQHRIEAIQGLVAINQSDAVVEILQTLQTREKESGESATTTGGKTTCLVIAEATD